MINVNIAWYVRNVKKDDKWVLVLSWKMHIYSKDKITLLVREKERKKVNIFCRQ